jgi:membrane protein DedA with SNARE-associated domain
MLHWFDSLLPNLPRYGYELVFLVVFLNNVGLPLPGETILLGAGFVLGRTAVPAWQPMVAGTAACFLGGICAFSLGRRLARSGLDRVRWLHLTPQRLAWPERVFKRHGAKTVFISRFIALLPPAATNLMAGMTNLTWPTFLLFNATGSAAFTVFYILLGYFFGKKWKLLQVWLGPTMPYVILIAIVLVALGFVFRKSLSATLQRGLNRITP